MNFYCKLIAGVPGIVNLTREQLAHPETCLPEAPTVEDLEGTGYAIWIAAERPAHDREHKAIEAAAEQVEPGIWEQRWTVAALDALELAASLAERKSRMLSDLAAKRWQAETAGFIWHRAPGEAFFIATDEGSQQKLGNERRAAQDGLRRPGDVWKCGSVATGQPVAIDFTDAEILEISADARNRTSDCFNNEGAIAGDIADGQTHAALDAIDLEAGWP